jgi:hypothetical protein
MLNLKGQNLKIKSLLIPLNTYNKPCSETAYFGGIVKKNARSSQKWHFFFGLPPPFSKIPISFKNGPNW